MKTPILLAAAALLTLGLATHDADAKRFGGGGNLGKQRAVPTMREAPKAAPASPANAAPAAPAATPAAPAAKPSFMSRWGGMLAGLGIGALLGSLFSGNLGGGIGMLLMFLVLGGVAFMVIRMLAARGKPDTKPIAFAGIGNNIAPTPSLELAGNTIASTGPARAESDVPADFPVEPFLRQAKMAFIRLQAANDARDLDDIRDYTTPEMYAEIAMQIEERGDAAQKTEVINVQPTLLEVANDGTYEIASVRFGGLIRETPEGSPEPFDEIWHVRKKAGDKSSAWLITGIQQYTP
jgi:predicted lipid-binding transport protein (Tim44 family)